MLNRYRTIVLLVVLVFSMAIFCSCKTDDSSENNSVSAATSTPDDSKEGLGDDSTSDQNKNDSVEYIEVTVSENKYLYDNKTISLDDLKKELKEKSISQVRITDENASQKAFSELTDYLEKNDVKFMVE